MEIKAVLDLAVLADDLTGGMIIASKLEAVGVVCPLVTDVALLAELPSDLSAVVLARKIRLSPADLARGEAGAAAEAFARLGARTIFYKYSGAFDSTAAGNIGPIAEVLVEAVRAERTLFCPAYIDRGITLYQGHLFFGSTLLSDSHKRLDPVTPALTSNIVAKLQGQTQWAVGLLDHQALAADVRAIKAALAEHGEVKFWVADAVDEDDIDKIADLTKDWPLVTGADSLPPAMALQRRAGAPAECGSGRRHLPASPGYEAVIAGSCGQATRNQLDAFAQHHPIWRIDLARDGDTPGLEDIIAAWAAERLSAGPVAVTTTADPAGVHAAQALYGRGGASQRADRILGAVALRLHELGSASSWSPAARPRVRSWRH